MKILPKQVLENNQNKILERFLELKKQQPKIRSLDAAKKLGVSELELLVARIGDEVIRLNNDIEEILKSLEPIGELMALTRNQSCVSERKGIYQNASFSKHGKMSIGLFANPDIDLRLFMNHWQHCFAVIENIGENFFRKSLQFFDKSGVAIHKIYSTPKSNLAEFDKIINKFKSQNQQDFVEIFVYDKPKPTKTDDEVNWQEFRLAWENLKDTHDFFPMLRKFNVARQQAFRKIGKDFAYKVDNNSAKKVLELARDKNCEIMVFVGNCGCIQIHTGFVNKLKPLDDWFNVLDPKFNLHLKESEIAESWITKKPTIDGIVSALEIFDKNGEIIATFFGKRKPGISELELWREIINEI